MERPLVSIISGLIRAKASVRHTIIPAKLAARPMEIEALTRLVSFVHSLWDIDRDIYARLALESSKQLALQGDTSCWIETSRFVSDLHWEIGDTEKFAVVNRLAKHHGAIFTVDSSEHCSIDNNSDVNAGIWKPSPKKVLPGCCVIGATESSLHVYILL
ncbi:hypothetical protein L7F22_013408 [Adiantum nelumboides]|nr:hypothetical protein [Adiantum nelumboides]